MFCVAPCKFRDTVRYIHNVDLPVPASVRKIGAFEIVVVPYLSRQHSHINAHPEVKAVIAFHSFNLAFLSADKHFSVFRTFPLESVSSHGR